MRILVIGGTAFTGPHVVRQLVREGHEVVLFHRGQTDAKLPKAVRHVLGDRREWEKYKDELQQIEPEMVLDQIAMGPQSAWEVLTTFRGIARRVVALSSQDVYRAYGTLIGLNDGPPDPAPLDEDAPLRELLYPYRGRAQNAEDRLYNYEKILVERLYLGQPELAATILRLPMVYGPRDRQHRTFEYLKRMDDGRRYLLLGKEMADWRWTRGYVGDVARAIALAVSDERAAGQVYNVGEPDALTELEWVQAIGLAAGWNGQIALVPLARLPAFLDPGINPAQPLVTDTARIRAELGYAERLPREEALRRTVDWQRNNPPEPIDASRFDYEAEDALLKELGV
jgi:nucleoside-diphosphate-sugar epimerase